MKTIEIIRGALLRRAEAPSPGVATPAWWATLAEELSVAGADLVKKRQLAQFAARFTGQAILVDAQSSNGREIASFELRMEGTTQNLACLPLNEAAMRQM
jgi:hypothetical protein